MTRRILCMFTTLIMVVGLMGILPSMTTAALTYDDYEHDVSDDGMSPDVGSYNAFLMYADKNWLWSNMSAQAGGNGYGVDAEITKDGTYTVSITGESVDQNSNGVNDQGKGGTDYASGAVYFCVDIAGLIKTEDFDANKEKSNGVTENGIFSEKDIKCQLKSIKMDGRELKFDASKILYGNLRENSTDYTIEIYNMYGDTNGNPPINPNSIKWSQKLEVTFSIYGLTSDVNSTDSSNTSNVTTTSYENTTEVQKTSTTLSNAKLNAKKAMKQARITKLKAKAKGKKINVSWKKVKKAKGYQLQVSAKKNFKKLIFNKTTSKNKLTVKNSKIKSKKNYYVRVRAYATYKDKNDKVIKVYSKWNKKLKKVKVK